MLTCSQQKLTFAAAQTGKTPTLIQSFDLPIYHCEFVNYLISKDI